MVKRTLFADESWCVEFAPERKCIVVTTSDYHAGPLCVTEEMWRQMGREFGIAEAGVAVASTPVSSPSPEVGARPADWVEMVQSGPWTVGVSRRAKEMIVECGDAPAAPLRIPRKQLYRIGKRMGKRG